MGQAPHVIYTNSWRSNVAIGLTLVPAIALLALAFEGFQRGGSWLLGGLGAFGLAVGMMILGGLMGRRLGVRLEISDHEIRAVDAGRATTIGWDQALSVSLDTGAAQRGTSVESLRVDDGAGNVIEAKIPLLMGRAMEPDAAAALTILRREAAIPLAQRQASRPRGVRLHQRGTYASFPRTAWVALVMGVLLPLPGLKLAVVDDFWLALPLCSALSALFLGYAFFCWAWVGELEIDEDTVRGQRRIGAGWSMPRAQISRVEIIGSQKADSLGVRLIAQQGRARVLPRVQPRAMRDLLGKLGS